MDDRRSAGWKSRLLLLLGVAVISCVLGYVGHVSGFRRVSLFQVGVVFALVWLVANRLALKVLGRPKSTPTEPPSKLMSFALVLFILALASCAVAKAVLGTESLDTVVPIAYGGVVCSVVLFCLTYVVAGR